MDKVINHIVSAVKNVDLSDFLIVLWNSKKINEQLLCMCILIELKFSLLTELDFVDTLDSLKGAILPINFENFTIHQKIRLTREYTGGKIQYSRVVDKTTFDVYIGSFAYRNPYVDEGKIRINGWSTRNGIVWITPKFEIDEILEEAGSIINPVPANDVCDHLGIPRNESGIKYIKINYSPNFSDKTYHPNSTNRLWHYEYNLYLSHECYNNFGKTYNENGIREAKEQVHETSFYWDNLFTADFIGEVSEKFPINAFIINEAEKRLGI